MCSKWSHKISNSSLGVSFIICVSQPVKSFSQVLDLIISFGWKYVVIVCVSSTIHNEGAEEDDEDEAL